MDTLYILPNIFPIHNLLLGSLIFSTNPVELFRSGSSYTGDLMSALARASYFFEPLWVLNKMNGQSIEKTVIGVSILYWLYWSAGQSIFYNPVKV